MEVGLVSPHNPLSPALCPNPLLTPLTLLRYLSWCSVVTWALLSSSAAKWVLPKCRTLATMLSRSWGTERGQAGIAGRTGSPTRTASGQSDGARPRWQSV